MHSSNSQSTALTVRALVIGALGSSVLTASSLFIALRMGMLPWPISFAAIASVLALKLFKSHNLHEANVMHAAMSAGSMIAGGLAFTIPGLWIMGLGQDLTIYEVLIAAFAGTLIGLIACAAFQPYFIREKQLAYPIGTAAADTLTAVGNNGAQDAPALFWGLGLSGAYAAVRDVLHLIPSVLFASNAIPGVALGMYNSPMSIAIGFAVGVVPTAVWFIGAVLGHLGIVGMLPAAGIIETATALDIRISLGLGLMLGSGAGTIAASVLRNKKMSKDDAMAPKDASSPTVATTADTSVASNTNNPDEQSRRLSTNLRIIALVCAIVVALICAVCKLSILTSTVVVLATWFCIYLSAWLTGTTGINPMEVFGMLVLLLVQALFRITSMKLLFLVAAMVAVACGIGGDVMNDLKAGDRLNTSPQEQMIGMIVGAFVGVLVSSLLLMGMYQVYGGNAFGPQGTFVAVQAANVAAMAGGISHIPAFMAGLALGGILAAGGLPVMTLGLGVYLPFFMSCGAALGAAIKFILDKTNKLHGSKADSVVSGILGGESLVGVLIALFALFSFIR